MAIRFLWLLMLAAAASACLGVRGPPRFGSLRAQNHPFQFRHDIRLYTAKNGMSVVLLPDSRANLVTVDARYRVGAADDPAGRAGLAHLVEHLTFEARTETEQASLGDRLGQAALQHNAFTSHDVTHYMATALAHQLPEVLELEAQRLEMACAQWDDTVFSRERDVVLEEAAERRTPLGDLLLEISRAVWGKDHPYARGLGTREVADTTKDEACRFFTSHYAPDRLTLVVTGDFDPEQAIHLISKRFSRITRQSGAPQAHIDPPGLTGTQSRHRADVKDAVALVFLPAPAWGSEDAVLHQLALMRLLQVMAQADREHDWITDVSLSTLGAGRAQLLAVMISVDDPKRLNAAVDELFARVPKMFSSIDPFQAANLLSRLQTRYAASYESFTGRGAWLADYLTYTRHNSFMMPELETINHTAIAGAGHYAQSRFVRKKSHVALIEPSGKLAAASQVTVASGREPDLAPWRAPVDPAEAQRPLPAPATRSFGEADGLTLSNGLRVVLAPDPSSLLVDARLIFPHGSASDPPGRRGRAGAAAALLEFDPIRRYRAGEFFLLGWGMSAGTQLDMDVLETSTVFSARGASNRAEWHVWRLMWLIDQCNYPDEAVEAFRRDAIRATAEETDPAEALIRQLLFGAGHPYSAPPPTGHEWNWLTSKELERYRLAYYVPRGATLIVTGGFDVEAMRTHVRELFEPWPDSPAAPAQALPAAQPMPGPNWVGTRDPSRTQVGLTVAFATASDPGRDKAARLILREMVSDRLRIIREGMGASYGVQASYAAASGGGALFVGGDLDPERAVKAAAAILSELEALRTGAGTLAEDFVRARRRVLASALAQGAGVTAVADELEHMVRRGLPADYRDRLLRAISQVTPAEIAAVAAADLDRGRMVVSVSATPERLDEVMSGLGATGPRIFDKKPRSRK